MPTPKKSPSRSTKTTTKRRSERSRVTTSPPSTRTSQDDRPVWANELFKLVRDALSGEWSRFTSTAVAPPAEAITRLELKLLAESPYINTTGFIHKAGAAPDANPVLANNVRITRSQPFDLSGLENGDYEYRFSIRDGVGSVTLAVMDVTNDVPHSSPGKFNAQYPNSRVYSFQVRR
jgi:hypothetical protein